MPEVSDKSKGIFGKMMGLFSRKPKDSIGPNSSSTEIISGIHKMLVQREDFRDKEYKDNLKNSKAEERLEKQRHREILKALTVKRPAKKTIEKKIEKETKKVKQEQKAKQVEKPVEAPKPKAELPKPAEKPEAPKPAAKPEAAKPTPKAEAPKPAAKPEVKPEVKPTAEPVKPAEIPKPKVEPVKPPEAPKPPAKVEPTKPTPKVEPVKPVIPSGTEAATKKMIMQHEGVVNYPYKDTKGLWTIGVGHLIGDGKSLPPEYEAYKNNGGPNDKKNNTTPAMTNEQIQKLFDDDYEKHKAMAMKTPGWALANETGQAAMIDLTYNMGSWFAIKNKNNNELLWKNTVAALESGNFDKAADGLKDSLWYKQVGNRAVKIVDMIRNGKKIQTTGPNVITPTTGQKVDSMSTENKDTKNSMKDQSAMERTINNVTVNSSQSSQTAPVKVDDRSAFERVTKG